MIYDTSSDMYLRYLKALKKANNKAFLPNKRGEKIKNIGSDLNDVAAQSA